jgi:hypothetical protein
MGCREYTKKSAEQLDVLIRDIQADSRRVKLLEILSPQFEQLVNRGHPDLHVFYEALKEEKLMSENELRELRVIFALEGVSDHRFTMTDRKLMQPNQDMLPDGELNAAVDHLIELVSTEIFGNRPLDDNDTIAVNESVELPCDIFQRLRQGKWLDAWTIMAAMQISDKPFFIKHGESVPLDEIGRYGRIKPIKRPLTGWAKKITELRRQAKETFGDTMRLVYFCPINHGNRHFTLLEINEREQAIRHYDSMAGSGTINGTKKTRVCGLVREEFGDLEFSYSEAVSIGLPAVFTGDGLTYNWGVAYSAAERRLELWYKGCLEFPIPVK